MPPSNKHERPNDIRLNRPGQRLKMIGGALLLFSFISQNFLYDRWDSRQKLLVNSTEQKILIDHSVYMNELLYMEVQPSDDPAYDERIKLIKLRKAATFYTSDVKMTLTLANVADLTRLSELSQGLQNINTYRDYEEYKESLNEVEKPAHASLMNELPELEVKKRTAQFLYLVVYLVGGLLALFGEIKIYQSGKS